jgi:hypothetical protein
MLIKDIQAFWWGGELQLEPWSIGIQVSEKDAAMLEALVRWSLDTAAHYAGGDERLMVGDDTV